MDTPVICINNDLLGHKLCVRLRNTSIIDTLKKKKNGEVGMFRVYFVPRN